MKQKRQQKIIQLIEMYDIETQEMLVDRLNQEGYNVTQATVSRDIRELKLTKVSAPDGRAHYAVLDSGGASAGDRFGRIIRDGVTSVDYSDTLIVIKTHNGMAMAVAAAIDAMQNTGIMGTIAGDDTIFCAAKSRQQAADFAQSLIKQ